MAIKGSLKEASLPDIVQLLYLGRRTGCMSVANDRHFASIWFDEGWITSAGLLGRPDRLGDRLIAAGHLTMPQLDLAIATQQSLPGRRLGSVLLQLGMIEAPVLERELRIQVEEAIFTLFTWTSGTFSFEAGLTPEVDEFVLRLNPEGLLLEGARRVDEWSVISRKVPSADAVFAVVDSPGDGAEPLDPLEQQIISLLDGRRTVRVLADTTAMTEFDVARALYALATAGRVHRVATASTPAVMRGSDARVAEHRNLGLAFYRTGMLAEAEREYAVVGDLRPEDGEGPFFQGMIALRQGRWDRAIERLRTARERSGDRPATLHNLALALQGAGQLDEAETTQAAAVEAASQQAALWVGWGLMALRRQDIDAARERLDRAATLFGEETPPARWYWGAGWTRALAGEWSEAVAMLRLGVDAYPDHPILRTALGVLLESAGEVGDAEQHLRHALTEDPGIPQISKNLGDLLYRSGRWDEAEEAYLRAVTLAPSLGDDVFFKLGNLACRRGDLGAAQAQWETALQLNPEHALVRANLAGSRSGG